MNEAETRAEYVDPKLKASGWGETEGSKVLREFRITEGRIQVGGERAKPEIADYVLVHKNQKLAVIEAKKEDLLPTEGASQAKTYAQKLQIEYTYSTNGKKIYEISMKTGKEGLIEKFPTPEELFSRVNAKSNERREKFSSVPFEKELNGIFISDDGKAIKKANQLGIKVLPGKEERHTVGFLKTVQLETITEHPITRSEAY